MRMKKVKTVKAVMTTLVTYVPSLDNGYSLSLLDYSTAVNPLFKQYHPRLGFHVS